MLSSDGCCLMVEMEPLLDDGALAFDDGFGAMSFIISMMEMT